MHKIIKSQDIPKNKVLKYSLGSALKYISLQ